MIYAVLKTQLPILVKFLLFPLPNLAYQKEREGGLQDGPLVFVHNVMQIYVFLLWDGSIITRPSSL